MPIGRHDLLTAWADFCTKLVSTLALICHFGRHYGWTSFPGVTFRIVPGSSLMYIKNKYLFFYTRNIFRVPYFIRAVTWFGKFKKTKKKLFYMHLRSSLWVSIYLLNFLIRNWVVFIRTYLKLVNNCFTGRDEVAGAAPTDIVLWGWTWPFNLHANPCYTFKSYYSATLLPCHVLILFFLLYLHVRIILWDVWCLLYMWVPLPFKVTVILRRSL